MLLPLPEVHVTMDITHLSSKFWGGGEHMAMNQHPPLTIIIFLVYNPRYWPTETINKGGQMRRMAVDPARAATRPLTVEDHYRNNDPSYRVQRERIQP